MTKMKYCLYFVVFIGFFTTVAEAAKRPIPRFVSVKSEEVRMRAGPGREYPVTWVIKFKGLPVKVVAEYQHWRQVMLPDKTTGWVHQSLLTGKRTLLTTAENARLLSREDSKAVPIAKIQKNAVLMLPKLKCAGTRCLVKTGDFNGWIEKQDVWGILEEE